MSINFSTKSRKVRSLSKDISYYLNRIEAGDAEMFAELHLDEVKYDHSDGAWHIWSKHYWERDKIVRINKAIDAIATVYEKYADKLSKKMKTDEEKAFCNLLRNRAKCLHTRRGIKNVLDLASSQPSIRLSGDEWNIDSNILPVKNGVIDLTTGKLRPGVPSEYINAFAPTEWHGLNQPCPNWEKFIAEICSQDPKMIAFLQRLLGYAISGATIEQVLFMLIGEGSDGKSTLFDALMKILGDAFSFSTQADSLMDVRVSDGEGARPFVCALRNKRLVCASESKDGQRLNIGLIKQLTGDQSITARNLYSSPVKFTSSHKIFLITNKMPILPDGGGYAIERRLVVVPFNARFVDDPKLPHERKRDKNILQKFEKEGPGILAWLVKGTLMWSKQGLNIPEECKIVAKTYLKDMNRFDQFISINVQVDAEYEISASLLYEHYENWCKDDGSDPLSKRAFGQQITRQFGEAKVKWLDGKPQKTYSGIRLITR